MPKEHSVLLACFQERRGRASSFALSIAAALYGWAAVLQFRNRFLHLELCGGESVATVEVLASLAVLPFSKVGIQLAFTMASAPRVDPELKNFPGNLLSKLKLQQIWINGSVAIFHIFTFSMRIGRVEIQIVRFLLASSKKGQTMTSCPFLCRLR
jgi:hypothetical protein